MLLGNIPNTAISNACITGLAFVLGGDKRLNTGHSDTGNKKHNERGAVGKGRVQCVVLCGFLVSNLSVLLLFCWIMVTTGTYPKLILSLVLRPHFAFNLFFLVSVI